jgi:hypothetical protein
MLGLMTQSMPKGRAFWAGWISAAVLLLVAAGAGVYAANAHNQLEDVQLRLVDAVLKLQLSEERVANATAGSDAMRENLVLMAAPDVTETVLKGAGPAPNAAGRVFSSPTRGLLVAATGLPAIEPNQTYQLWFLTRGAPVSAGLIRPDQQGNATAAFDAVSEAQQATGLALSLEPDGGATKPTGPICLVSAEQKR